LEFAYGVFVQNALSTKGENSVSRLFDISAGAILIASLAFAFPAIAADQHEHGHSGPSFTTHGGGPSGGFNPGSGSHPSAMFSGVHGGMPPSGFKGAPNNFRGFVFHGGPSSSHTMDRRFQGPGRYQGTFRGRDFGHFSGADREAWRGGDWHHEWHNGHYGWWWVTGGLWYFYPAPIYPYPLYIGPDYYYDYYDQFGAPSYYWYYCEDPPGYYPNVQQCNGPWEPVPPNG
jgi:hypothetical protein